MWSLCFRCHRCSLSHPYRRRPSCRPRSSRTRRRGARARAPSRQSFIRMVRSSWVGVGLGRHRRVSRFPRFDDRLRPMSGTMRALRKTARRAAAPSSSTSPSPNPGEDEVLVRVHAASICGTDLHIYDWNEWAEKRILRVPMTFGHEVAGTGRGRRAPRSTTCSPVRSSPPRRTSRAVAARRAGPGAPTSAGTCASSASTPTARSPEYVVVPAANAWIVGEGIHPDQRP